MVTARARAPVTTLTAPTIAAARICQELNWQLMDICAKILTSAGRTMAAVLTRVSTRSALLIALVPKATCWQMIGKRVKISTNVITVQMMMIRIDYVLAFAAIVSDPMCASIRMKNQFFVHLDMMMKMKMAIAMILMSVPCRTVDARIFAPIPKALIDANVHPVSLLKRTTKLAKISTNALPITVDAPTPVSTCPAVTNAPALKVTP